MKRVTIRSTIGTLVFFCVIVILFSGKNCDECFSPTALAAKFFISGLILFIGSIYFTRIYLKNEHIMFGIETLPLLETDEATADVPFCCEATIVADDKHILTSPYCHIQCVYYHSITEEYVKRGKHSSWVVLENLINFVPFYIADERGRLRVDVTNIDDDFSGHKIVNKNTIIPDPSLSEIDAMPVLRNSEYGVGKKILGFIQTGSRMRRSEYVLAPKSDAFAHGYISWRNGELVLHEHVGHPLIISQKKKDAYVYEFYKGQNLVFFNHLLVAIGVTIAGLSLNYFLNLPELLVWSVLIGVNVCIVGSVGFSLYNRLIMLRVRAHTALSNIDIELQRRANLIPQIVACVQEYTRHEKEVMQVVAQLRTERVMQNALSDGPRIDASSLFALGEKYPGLQASQAYQKLMLTLVDTEERLAYSRAFYNRNVLKHNTLISQFPFNVIAGVCGMRPMQYLSLLQEPQVSQYK